MPATIPLEERNLWGAIQCSKMKRRETVPEVAYADDAGAAPFGSSSHASAGSALPKVRHDILANLVRYSFFYILF